MPSRGGGSGMILQAPQGSALRSAEAHGRAAASSWRPLRSSSHIELRDVGAGVDETVGVGNLDACDYRLWSGRGHGRFGVLRRGLAHQTIIVDRPGISRPASHRARRSGPRVNGSAGCAVREDVPSVPDVPLLRRHPTLTLEARKTGIGASLGKVTRRNGPHADPVGCWELRT